MPLATVKGFRKGAVPRDLVEKQYGKAIKQEEVKKVVDLGGTISGEHGIGLVQKPFMDLAFSERTLQLQRDIKKVFDPKGIFNPGKIFPEA